MFLHSPNCAADVAFEVALTRELWRMVVPYRPSPCTLKEFATKLAELLQEQKATAPLALRCHPEMTGLAALDLPQRHGGASWSTRDMALLFCYCGRHDAELRDVLGAGHARLLSLAPTRRFDKLLKAVSQGELLLRDRNY